MRAALFCAALAATLTACAGSFNEAAMVAREARAVESANAAGVPVVAPPLPSERCISLDDAHRAWGGAAKFAAVAAGGAGVGAIPAPDGAWRVGLAIGGAVAATVAGGSLWVAEDYATAWVRECSAP